VEPKPGGYVSSFDRLSAFVCAVQTAAIGREETAQAIWRRFGGSGWWSDARFGENIADQLKDQRQLLARCIFDHLRNALLKAGVDRKEVHTRMRALLTEFPKLNADWRAELFADLTTTVNAAIPRAGSVEALLMDWAARPSNMRHLGMYDTHTKAADAPARAILSRGLDAVPELIALRKDRRVTAHEQPAFMKAPARIKRVGELARQLVREIAGDQASFPKYGDDTDALRAWWEKVQTQDESVSLLQGVFSREGGKITGVNEGPIRVVAKKFPGKLRDLCNEFARGASPDAQPDALAEAIAESDIPKEERVRILSAFAGHGSLEHKRCVLQNLAKMDDKACAVLLLPILHQLPTDATDPYWTCPEARFTHVVVQIEDDDVWKAYLQCAKRSSVGLRMEMMNPMNYTYMAARNLARRLAFLSAFLDDAAVRTMSDERGQFEGPCAGFTIPRLAVRDLAAMKLASLLDMKEAPDEFWTDAQWVELRRKVKDRLAGEKLPDL
jgi:flagellar motility protein MotE (MotC chaperone)